MRLSSLLDFFKGTKNGLSQNEPQSPRLHHYNFAYKALPGLAFTDPYVPLGFASDTPNGRLAKFWKLVGNRLPVNERIDSTGLWAAYVLADSMAFLVITMPPPLNKSEAYFVAIIYPQSWFDDPTEKSKLPAHFPQYFILAMSDVPGAEGVSGGTLRLFNKAGHGAVKFGVPVTDSAFMVEIRHFLKKPAQCV